jgi:hypothetical protein
MRLARAPSQLSHALETIIVPLDVTEAACFTEALMELHLDAEYLIRVVLVP